MIQLKMIKYAVSCLLLTFTMLSQAKELIIFDTDMPYLKDDGLALAMLLQQRTKFKILGITTVAGNDWVPQGLEYTFRTLTLMNASHIPVYVGAKSPLIQSAERAKQQNKLLKNTMGWQGAFGKPRPKHRHNLRPPYMGFTKLKPKPQTAVDFIIETINAHPGEITLLAIGPLTNIAMAIRLRPEIETKIKRIVIMGGNVYAPGNTTPHAEFNVWFDPEAAKIVLNSQIPQKILFGLDITDKAFLTKEQFLEISNHKPETELTQYFKHALGTVHPKFLSTHKKKTGIWDCLPAAYLIDPSFVTQSDYFTLDVETQFGPKYGKVISKKNSNPNDTQVMLNLNLDKFYTVFKKLMTAPIEK